MTKTILTFGLGLALGATVFAQGDYDNPTWMRYPALSPDGSEIAFTFQGDIYKVPVSGGRAVRLTTNEAYDTMPMWAPDGKTLAFVSTRTYGSKDIYIMDANGGVARRVTTHSASETPAYFSPDGKYIYFIAHIQDDAASALFPMGRMSELYRVPVTGGRTELVLGTPLASPSLSQNGDFMLYEDEKSMENVWRKHQKSAAAKDIFRYDFKEKKFTPLVMWEGEDRNPVLAPTGDKFYFLSERSGTFNVFEADLSNPERIVQLTDFRHHPVRFLSVSRTGKLAFGHDGEIYTLTPGGKAEKVDISIQNDLGSGMPTLVTTTRGRIRGASVSPDGKQIAFITGGEVFVTSSDYKTTKRITNTPAEESSVSFGSDGRSLVYASRRDGRSDLYIATIERDGEKAFPNATLIREEKLIPDVAGEKMNPDFAPNGEDVAFVLDRQKIAVYNIKTHKLHEVTDGSVTSEVDGSVPFVWSPDSKWLALNITTNHHEPYADVVLVDATKTHGELHNLTNTGYFAMNPRFVMGGDAIIYSSEQYGMRNHASWGSMSDVMIMFLNREAYNKFRLNKEEYELLTEEEKEAKKEAEKAKDKDGKEAEDADKPIRVELANIESRIMRLTPASSDLGDAYITPDGKKLYYMAAFEGGYDLWEKDLREGHAKLINKMDGDYYSMTPDKEGKTLFLISGNDMKKLDLSSGKITPIIYAAEYSLDKEKEREAMFNYVELEEAARFYVKDMHGVDWAKLTDHYRKFLPYINNNYDFSEMLSELLGELNVSHTGSGYRSGSGAPQTAELGLFLDLTHPSDKGLLVQEVVVGGPFDLYSSKVKAGDYLTAIDGTEITADTDYFPLLEGKAGKQVLVSFRNADGNEWDEVIKPISAGRLSGLLYDRWVAAREKEVEKLSGGRLGYVHIASMDDESFRRVYAKALGKYYRCDGIVIDVRYNGGGRLHEDIEVLFSGEKYLTQEIRGKYYCDMPSRRWTKPSVMVTCEADYSNAHGTPWVYQHQKLGKVVGMPVAGTMTSVNWVTLQDPSLYFGIPAVGYKTAEGYYLENHQMNPDVVVRLDFNKALSGTDTQIEKAVEVLRQEIK